MNPLDHRVAFQQEVVRIASARPHDGTIVPDTANHIHSPRRPALKPADQLIFTYLLHVWIAHGLAVVVGMVLGVPPSAFIDTITDPSRLIGLGWGFDLGGVYLAWAAVLVLLYPLSRWFEDLKRRRRDWWLGYL